MCDMELCKLDPLTISELNNSDEAANNLCLLSLAIFLLKSDTDFLSSSWRSRKGTQLVMHSSYTSRVRRPRCTVIGFTLFGSDGKACRNSGSGLWVGFLLRRRSAFTSSRSIHQLANLFIFLQCRWQGNGWPILEMYFKTRGSSC